MEIATGGRLEDGGRTEDGKGKKEFNRQKCPINKRRFLAEAGARDVGLQIKVGREFKGWGRSYLLSKHS